MPAPRTPLERDRDRGRPPRSGRPAAPPRRFGDLIRKLNGSCGPALDAVRGDDVAALQALWNSHADGIGMLWFCREIMVAEALLVACCRACLGDPSVPDSGAGVRALLARHGESTRFGGAPRVPDLYADVVRAHIPWSAVIARLAPDAGGAYQPIQRRGR